MIMAKRVSFGVSWQEYGRQSVVLPDSVDSKNPGAVLEYIQSVFDELPLPSGEYVTDSAEIDVDSALDIIDEEEYRRLG